MYSQLLASLLDIAAAAPASAAPHEAETDDDEGDDEAEELERIICFDLGAFIAKGPAGTAASMFAQDTGDGL